MHAGSQDIGKEHASWHDIQCLLSEALDLVRIAQRWHSKVSNTVTPDLTHAYHKLANHKRLKVKCDWVQVGDMFTGEKSLDSGPRTNDCFCRTDLMHLSL